MKQAIWIQFLKDVFLCALGSYGGPEAHYGIFSSVLVEKRNYLTEEELAELIGLFAIVPGPSSTQTITAIGYHVGGPILSVLTFLVWVLPAIMIMGTVGVFFTHIDDTTHWQQLVVFLPAIAVSFIIYAAVKLSRKMVKTRLDGLLYIVMLLLSLWLVRYSMWFVPVLLVCGGIVTFMLNRFNRNVETLTYQPKWSILVWVMGLALLNEAIVKWVTSPFIVLYTSFYRYGYSVIGGGQIVIPLMIQDLVQTQSLISQADFLSGYAIDQAIPGPLFSFAAFVSARVFAESGVAFLASLVGGFSIFLPGILLVFFIFPLWKSVREVAYIKHFLRGVSITAASLMTMTAITQCLQLPMNLTVYIIVLMGVLLLWWQKIPAPLIVLFVALLGLVVSV